MAAFFDPILEDALRRIAQAEMRVHLQEGLVEHLLAGGYDTYIAQETLTVLRQSLALFRANYERVLTVSGGPGVGAYESQLPLDR